MSAKPEQYAVVWSDVTISPAALTRAVEFYLAKPNEQLAALFTNTQGERLRHLAVQIAEARYWASERKKAAAKAAKEEQAQP